MVKKPVAPGGENGENTIYKVSKRFFDWVLVRAMKLTLYRRRIGELTGIPDIESTTNRDPFSSSSGV